MSHHWRIRCVDCNAVNGSWINRGDVVVRDAIRLAPQLAALGFAAKSAVIHARVTIDHDDFDLAFFADHAGHKLVPHDEYGRDDDQCLKHVTCDCGHRHARRLDDGHDGPCAGGHR